MSERENLKAFIQKLLELRHTEKPISLEEMKAIAQGMGMSEADWQNVLQAFEGYLLRAKGHLKYKNWQDAINELEQALALNSYHAEVLANLAQAYYQKWKAKHRSSDKDKALYYAEKCIQFHPTFALAYQIKSEIKAFLQTKRTFDRLFFWILFIILLLIGIGIFTLKKDKQHTQESFTSPSPSASPSPSPAHPTAPVFLNSNTYQDLAWEQGAHPGPGIKVAAMMENFYMIGMSETTIDYQVDLSFKNTGQKAISYLRILIILYDDENKEISRNIASVFKGIGKQKLEPNQTFRYQFKTSFWYSLLVNKSRCSIKILKAE